MAVLPPRIIYWLVGEVVLTSLPRSEGSFVSRAAFKRIGKPWIPLGATHWRTHPDREWTPVSELPAAWGLARVVKVDAEHGEEEEMTEEELRQWRNRQKGKT